MTFFNEFGKKWASEGSVEPISETQKKSGWDFLGSVPPISGQFNLVQQNTDEKINYLFNLINSLVISRGGSLTATSTNELRNIINQVLEVALAGHVGYVSKADMLADTTRPAKTIAEVLGDPIEANNGTYIYDGSTWVLQPDRLAIAKVNLQGTVYDTETAGRLASVDGQTFKVIGSGDVAAREYRRTNASTSVLVAEYPATVSVSRINSLIATSGESPKAAHIFEDGDGLALGYIDSKGGFFTAESTYSHQRQISSAQGRANLALRAQLVGAPLLNDVAIADSNPSLFVSTLVAPYGMSGTSIQRTPAVVATASHGLLMFWGAGDSAYNGDSTGVTMYRCNVTYNPNNGSLMAGPSVLFQAPSTPSGVVKHPMLCRLASGRIVLCYDTNDVSGEVGKYHIYCRVSDDDGVTFSEPKEIAALTELNTVLACGTSGSITVMSDGRLVLPIYGMWSGTNMVSCLYSDDDGETWEMGGKATTPASSANESCAVELPNGDLLFIARWGGRGNKAIFRSVDRGETLVFDREAFDLPGYASAPSAIFDQGKIICSAPTSPETGMRTKHRIKISYDNGSSFYIGSGLFHDSYYVGYSSLCKIADGVLAMAYEASSIVNINYKESIFLCVFNISEVYNNVRTN